MPLRLPTMPYRHHLHQGNELGIDQRRIILENVLNLNDEFRHVTVGLGPVDGILP